MVLTIHVRAVFEKTSVRCVEPIQKRISFAHNSAMLSLSLDDILTFFLITDLASLNHFFQQTQYVIHP